jgi:hypothetical protein
MFTLIPMGAVKDKLKNKVFTAAVVLGLAVTTFMVISPVLAQSYWGNDVGEEFIPPMYGGWYANESMPYWDQNGTYHMPYWGGDGESDWVPPMYSSEDGYYCGGPGNGAYGGMMGGYRPSGSRNDAFRPN